MAWSALLTTALVSGVVSILTLVLQEALFPRSLELWRERRALAAKFRRYRDPIVLSARELASRFREIHDEFPTVFLDRKLSDVDDPFDVVNDASSVHFQKYKFFSTLYRLCAFCGWIELYRSEVVFLDAGRDHANRELERRLRAVQSDLADGEWNEHPDRPAWTDRLLFREEQRAIGEAMMTGGPPDRSVIGYGAFVSALEAREPRVTRAVLPALIFVSDPAEDHDFRRIRFREVALHLVALIEQLDARRLPDDLRSWRDGVLRRRDEERRWLELRPLPGAPGAHGRAP